MREEPAQAPRAFGRPDRPSLRKEIWAVDLRSGAARPLSDLGPGEVIGDFDVAADGRRIVFDRAREGSDIALIELADAD